MSVRFRPATRADLPVVLALLAEDLLSDQHPVTIADHEAALSAMQAQGHLLIVAEDAGRIVATYQLALITGVSLSAMRRAVLEGVRVASDRRGQGIGAALLADAEGRARASGASVMMLTSNAARRDARRFYERAGYAASHVGFKKPLVMPT